MVVGVNTALSPAPTSSTAPVAVTPDHQQVLVRLAGQLRVAVGALQADLLHPRPGNGALEDGQDQDAGADLRRRVGRVRERGHPGLLLTNDERLTDDELTDDERRSV
jgi:hypothetical protein